MRRVIAIVATLAVGLAVSNPVAEGRAARTVDVADDFFDPAFLAIREDTVVRFTWVGVNQHNVIKADGPGRYFESDTHEGAGFVYSHRFRKRGMYRIICGLHDGMEMNLRVKRRRR